MIKLIKFHILLGFLALFSSLSHGADYVNTGWFNSTAIKGYDTVAYFTEGRPVKGSEQYQHEWKDAVWQFSSAANLEKFKEDPEKYAPQFGGYCAYAVALGKTAGIDPSQFTVVEDKLYLNFNEDVQSKWLANRDDFIEQGHQNWPGVLN